ncbi:ATP-binding protein [Nonomuraea sp. H19]|uniref:ATP-binding protein n=1 Tax=Nonomuraea sp. H19 TaxID=3452206 RepID=UPI003F887E88
MTDSTGARSVNLGQFRLTRLQVVNWGTFCGYKDLPIDERGVLFTGPSGSGKSSLLDAHSVALLPSRDQRFNASADLTAKGAKQSTRNGADYVRGAWSENDDEHGQSQVRYLRGGKPTWSAVAATYDDGHETVTTGIVVKWFTGTDNDGSALKTMHLIHDGHFDLTALDGWAHRQQQPFDLRWLKAAYPAPATVYPPSEIDYTRKLAARIGLGESKTALSLLGKAKAMKNVGDLNLFIRENMLDEPETFTAADTMIALFKPLDQAYQTAYRAHAQQQVLEPIPASWQRYRSAKHDSSRAATLHGEAAQRYLRGVHLRLLHEEITRLGQHIGRLTEQLADERVQQGEAERAYASLSEQLREQGQALTALQAQYDQATTQQNTRKTAYQLFSSHVQRLGLPAPHDQEGFTALRAQLGSLLQQARAKQALIQPRRRDAGQRAGQAAARHRDRAAELAALRQAGTLIPLKATERRERIAHGAGVPLQDLVYAAELIDIADGQERWRPAAERVLRSFGLRLLVPERHSDAVKTFIDDHDMRGIVEYSIVTATSAHQPQPSPRTLAGKLTVDRGHPSGLWLAAQIARQFDHVCVETALDLRHHPVAVTVRGTVKMRGNHYRKDDRPELTAPSSFILGANTTAKIAALEAEVAELQAAQERADAEADDLDQQWQASQTAIDAAAQLEAYPTWTDLDHWASARAAADLHRRIEDIKARDVNLKRLQDDCDQAKSIWEEKIGTCAQTEAAIATAKTRHRQLEDEHRKERFHGHHVDEDDRVFLDEVYAGLDITPSVDRRSELERALHKELEHRRRAADAKQQTAAGEIKSAIGMFQHRWRDVAPDDSDDIDRCGAAYVALYHEIADRRLPEAMTRFQKMISEDMVPSVSVLYRTIETATSAIKKKIDMVNAGLRRVEFNEGTSLQIAYNPRQFQAAKEFRRIVDDLHLHASAAGRKRDPLLDQFTRVRDLMIRFTADDPEAKRWREAVLDVRLSFSFYGREESADHGTVHTYRNTAAGSGGEQEKLVAFCLAAALSYNLADASSGGRPRFAPLMLDEAFSKSDETFAAQALAAFDEFGFQLLIAAPIRMSGVLEPFIGQAILVEKRITADGAHSNAASATFGELATRHAAETDGAGHAAA